MFTITKGEAKQQSVKINRVESLGNNNYYKVTGSVSGAKSCKRWSPWCKRIAWIRNWASLLRH